MIKAGYKVGKRDNWTLSIVKDSVDELVEKFDYIHPNDTKKHLESVSKYIKKKQGRDEF